MADLVTTQVLADGARNAVIKFTSQSDGTGEAAVAKVDVSALKGSPLKVTIESIHYATSGTEVDILWNATADVLAWTIPADESGYCDFGKFGGLPNPGAAGSNGDINFTTRNAADGDAYSIVLCMRKD